MTKNNGKGCEYGRQTRLMLNQTNKDISEINNIVKDIRENNIQMFNHFTKRYEQMFEKLRDKVPMWVVALAGIASALISGMIMWIVTRGGI